MITHEPRLPSEKDKRTNTRSTATEGIFQHFQRVSKAYINKQNVQSSDASLSCTHVKTHRLARHTSGTQHRLPLAVGGLFLKQLRPIQGRTSEHDPKRICGCSPDVQLFTQTYKISHFNNIYFAFCALPIFEPCGHHQQKPAYGALQDSSLHSSQSSCGHAKPLLASPRAFSKCRSAHCF